ncbi:MAG: glycerophosphodiester phosphodiesterase family protein [Planctomycetota bacterium]|nr:glycerophosphodiester phosphodiesterase family protein [Planctomycetota bacterium]
MWLPAWHHAWTLGSEIAEYPSMGVTLIMSLLLAFSMETGMAGTTQDKQRRVGVVAHRGAGAGASRPERPPENTVQACLWGWGQGAPWVECDVILSGDGVPVVRHDFSTERCADVSVDVSKSTLQELQSLDVGSWKDQRWTGLGVSTLGEVLAVVPDDCGLVIEIKSGPESAGPVIEAIRAGDADFDRLMIISFNIDTLRAIRKGCPEVPVLWLMSFKQQQQGEDTPPAWTVSWRSGAGQGNRIEQPLDLEAIIAEVTREGFDGLDTTVAHPRDLAAKLHGSGLILGVWTVNDPQVAVKLVQSGVDEITTDDPPAVIQALAEAGMEVHCWPRRRLRTKPPAE